jgi:polysaccharide biosynthesis transport protein
MDESYYLDPYSPDAEYFSPNGYYGDRPAGNEKQFFIRLLSTLARYWAVILILPLLITTLVIIYEAQKPEYYEAKVTIQINNEWNPASGAGQAGTVLLNASTDAAYFSTQLQILEGSGLLRRVIKSTDLENNEAFLRSRRGSGRTVWQNVLRMFGLYKPQPEPEVVSQATSVNKLVLKKDTSDGDAEVEAERLAPLVSFLKSNLDVSPVKDSRAGTTRLVEVAFTHNDPLLASKIANAVAETYVIQNLEQKIQSNANAGDFLQKRVAELQSDIRLGEERLMNYSKSNQIVSLDGAQNTVVQRLTALNTQLGQAENERITAEAAFRAALQNPMINQTAEGKDARTVTLQAQLTTLKQQLDKLKTEFTDEWPAVIDTRRQIASVEAELKTTRKLATDTQLAALEQPYRQALARERELRRNFEQQRSEVLTQNEAAINYRILQQEIDTNKKLLDGLLQKSRETDVILNGTPNNVLISDRAMAPSSPSGPNRSRNVIVAFLASLFAGVGLAFILGWLNDSVRNTDDLEQQLGLPLIGRIPSALTGFKRKLLPARLGLRRQHPGRRKDYNLESFSKPIIQEAYHQLRASLLLSTPGGSPRTILVTSGGPSEGKTISALNLAKSLSQLGGRVLLIDADLRCPQLHFASEVNNSIGLTSLLTSKVITQEAIDRTLRAGAENNLFVLTAGPQTPNPPNLLSSDQMRDLLKKLEQQFAHIVIDSPPVLYFADSIVLSTYVDAVVLIARDSITSRQVLLKTRKVLQDVRAKVIGVVLNDIPSRSYKYYMYDYYRRLELPDPDDNRVLNLG